MAEYGRIDAQVEADFGRRFAKIEPIDRGWSSDRKYRVVEQDGTVYLLRVSSAERYDERRRLFAYLHELDVLGLPMSRPVDFGRCRAGVYMLLSWIDGEDLEDALARLSDAEQYSLGVESGALLRLIHSLPAPPDWPPWAPHFNAKIERKLAAYEACGQPIPGGEHLVAYLEAQRDLLEGRPQCVHHGDYHVGNMMLEDGKLRIIDFDRWDIGDPWEEFNRIVWSAQASPPFATGQLRGYFDGEVPEAFWPLLALYIASNTLGSLAWASAYGEGQEQVMQRQAAEVLGWYDNMARLVPRWYLRDMSV